jgi:sugar O-acyltransferase (sialic acid O-acetyltransferase NeuD family)
VAAVTRRLVIYGAGGHGRVCLDIARAAGYEVLGFCDPAVVPGTSLNGAPVLTEERIADLARAEQDLAFFVAIGDQARKRLLATRFLDRGETLALLVHPSAVVSPSARLGPGTVIMPNVVVNANATVGSFCILNTACSVDHDCVLADGVQLGPGARLAGAVTIGDDAALGTGVNVIPGCRIGARSVVGAGATVVSSLPDDVLAVGVPARVLRRLP